MELSLYDEAEYRPDIVIIEIAECNDGVRQKEGPDPLSLHR